MRIASTVSTNNLYNKSFKRKQENHIENQVKQVLYENFDDVNKQTIKRSQTEILNVCLPKFKKELNQEKGVVSKQDLKTIMSTLADIYKKSGLEKDAEILSSYSKN